MSPEIDIPDTGTTPKPEAQTPPCQTNVNITSETIKASEVSSSVDSDQPKQGGQQDKASEPLRCSPGREVPDAGNGAGATAKGTTEPALVIAGMDELELFFPEKPRAILLHGARHLVNDCGVKSARIVSAFMTKQHIVPPSQRIENTPT